MTGRVAQMGRGVMQDVATPHDRPDGAEHGGVAHGRRTRPGGRRRLGGIAAGLGGRRSREAHLRLGGASRPGPLAALAGYALLSLALFGRGVLRDGGGSVVGSYGSDQATFAWSLAWWPHAIEHGLHPLLTDLVYAPDGWNLAWTSAIPGPALLAWPLTAAFGPVAGLRRAGARGAGARGLVHVSCSAASSAPAAPAALAGGLVFGFGTLRGRRDAQPPQPRARLHAPAGRLRRRPLPARQRSRTAGSSRLRRSASLGIFATFLETLFWATLGGALALAAGLVVDARPRARAARSAACCCAALAYGIALLAASPYLWVALAHPDPLGISGRGFELDLANLIVPTRVTEMRPSSLHDLAEQLGGNNLTEQLGYVGPVLPALAGFALWERRREPLARVLARRRSPWRPLCALGSRLVVAGHRTWLELPWALVDDLPLASHALPVRAFVLVWLALAVHRRAVPRARRPRCAGSSSGCSRSRSRRAWTAASGSTRLDRPALFAGRSLARGHAPGRERADHPVQLRRPGDAVAGGGRLRLPHDRRLRQRDASRRALEYPIVRAIYGAPLPPFPGRELRALARERQVDVVLLRRGWPGPWEGVCARPSGRPRARAACSPGGCAAPGRARSGPCSDLDRRASPSTSSISACAAVMHDDDQQQPDETADLDRVTEDARRSLPGRRTSTGT